MEAGAGGTVFKVLSSDNLIYGPVDVATLTQWTRERRVQRETWVYTEPANQWVAAATITDLQPEFDRLDDTPVTSTSAPLATPRVTVDELRGFERFAPFSSEDLSVLISFCEVVTAAKGDVIIKKGDLSDSMFLVVSGQVRARIRVGGHDTNLGMMEPGEVFGEVAMLSHSARSADVVAETSTCLLRLTSERFQQMMSEHPALAARLLYNISRLLATRLSQRNQELQKDLASSFVWR